MSFSMVQVIYTSPVQMVKRTKNLIALPSTALLMESNPLTYETRKSDMTRSGIAQNSSVRTRTPLFNTPPRREFLIHHLTTAAIPRVKARAAKNEEREEKVRRALEEIAQFGTSFEDLHHKYGIPKSTLSNRAKGRQSRQKAHEVYQALSPAIEDALRNGLSGVSPKTRYFQGHS